MEKNNQKKKVSMLFSKELEKLGYSKHKLETKASEVKILEHLANSRGRIKMFATGSNTEGVDISGSDRDTMVVLNDLIAVWPDEGITKTCMSDSKDKGVFVIEKSVKRPCYAKLKCVQDGSTDTLFQCTGGKDSMCKLNESGNSYLSNKLFTQQATQHITNLLESSPDHIIRTFHVHGPCTSFENIVHTTEFDADFAFCIPCKTIPDDMLPSKNRQRASKWLHDLIEGMEGSGCHLAAVGSKTDEHDIDELEWRISFALIERKLVWSLDDMHCKCYVLMKMLIKEFISPIACDLISSYMLKTTILWLKEEEALQPDEETLIENIVLCIKRLCSYIKTKTLPHYIIPDNNLLVRKVDDDTMRQKLIKKLEEVISDPWINLLQCKAMSCLFEIWKEFEPDVDNFYRHARHPNLKPLMYKDTISFRSAQTMLLSVCDFSVTPGIHLDMLKSLSKLPDSVHKHPASFLTRVIANRILFSAASGDAREMDLLYQNTVIDELILESEKVCSSETVCAPATPSGKGDEYQKMEVCSVKPLFAPATSPVKGDEQQKVEDTKTQLSVDSMWLSSSYDVCTLKLQQAVKHFHCGDYESAYGALQNVMASYKPHVLYIGLCGPEEVGEEDIIEYLCYITTSDDFPVEEKISKCLTFDYIICRYDPVLPIFNLERMLWSEAEVPLCVHPRVLIYYLMFLVHYAEDREESALVSLSYLLINVLGTAHRSKLYGHIAWNLVGHGYFLLGNYKKAARAFRASLKARPTFNPAIYYLGSC